MKYVDTMPLAAASSGLRPDGCTIHQKSAKMGELSTLRLRVEQSRWLAALRSSDQP
jgi:hypothetical protein